VKLAPALAALLAAAAPSAALAAQLALYPLERVGEDDDAAVVASLLDAAVHQAARRSELRAAEPLLARPRCGPATLAATPCLAESAGRGLLARAFVRRAQGFLVVTLELVDGRGRVFGPVRVGLETAVQNSEPLTRALLDLAARAEAPALVLAASPGAAAAAASVAAAAPPLAPAGPAPVRPSWQARTAPWLGAAGVLLATAGGMFAASRETLTAKLDQKRASGTLTEGDARWQAEADRYGARSRALLVAGGACGAAGLALWALAPSVVPIQGGAAVGVGGRF